MARDYSLPPALDLTVDDLVILPDGSRYELIDGKLDMRDRRSLSDLAPLALLAELRAACPPGFHVVPRKALDAAGHAPDVTVLDPAGEIVLAVDAIRNDRRMADALGLMRAYSARGVPACWVFEAPGDRGASLTVFCAAGDGSFEVESTAIGEVFSTESPYPVSVDLHLLSCCWPQTFEYVGRRSDEGVRR